VKEMGLRGVLLSAWPSGNMNLSAGGRSVLRRAEKLGCRSASNCGPLARGKVPAKPKTPVEEKMARGEATGGSKLSALSGAGLDTMPLIMGEIILTGVLDRFPKLRFVSVEAGIGWVPYYAEQMDDRYDRNKYWAKIKLEREPSEYVKTNWWFTFIIDHYGVKNGRPSASTNIMWSTDYPHHGCDWPRSRTRVGEMMQDVPAAERRKIAYENAARLYGIRPANRRRRKANTLPLSLTPPRNRGQSSRGVNRDGDSVNASNGHRWRTADLRRHHLGLPGPERSARILPGAVPAGHAPRETRDRRGALRRRFADEPIRHRVRQPILRCVRRVSSQWPIAKNAGNPHSRIPERATSSFCRRSS